MRSQKLGKLTSAIIENINSFGIWIFVNEKEYFLSYEQFPYFAEQKVSSINNVQLLHGSHLYWPDLDIDLEIDNFENPSKYPLISRTEKR
jgi:hypothetical protein